MATTITINVTNNSNVMQNFFIFQQPAIYTGGPQVYTNSLYSLPVMPYESSGAVLSFTMMLQYYAGAQQQVSPPQIGKPSGQLGAIQAIDLTPAAGGTPTNNTTVMSVSPSLGLSKPTNTDGPQKGSFRIKTPTFNPVVTPYNAGSAVQSTAGGITLSNFVPVSPNTNLDCQPIIKFYVQTGTYTAGTVMNFTASSQNAAICDATQGFTTFNVSYNLDGTWTVQNMASMMLANGRRGLIEKSTITSTRANVNGAANAEVLNEAGTASIARGYAADMLAPTTITHLDVPGALQQFNEYQIGWIGGPYRGTMCTQLDVPNATAVFE
ncbi:MULTISPECIES: hypothetical protein [Rhodopseudomonas]|uniref:Uncharacterized protein n=1 Tax=Rhodopseudomonas palustris (strain DX-1) TaxID=652103 RepID=E6VHN6_RHOPX|nr:MULTISPECIES: hypothetical protein [Rhodopseudomonas]NEW87240.1 hypothetical protein [Rhodopseudomonas sp. WA056]QDL97556.1 hypothetical protein FLL57_09655 [Rhodopseudomonas palustris]